MMHFARASLSQPYWIYQPGIAFESLIRRGGRPRETVTGSDGDLSAAIARSPDELRAATALVESRYAARGYRVGSGEGEPRPSVTLIATQREAIVGTVTVGFDGPLGLVADESYGNMIDAVRRARGGVCEITRLAVAGSADSRRILAALFGSAYVVGRRLHRVTDAFVEVNPRHARFHRALFGFAVAAGQRMCPRVMAPGVLLRLQIERLDVRLANSEVTARSLPARTGLDGVLA